MDKYMKKQLDLDGVYTRIERAGKYHSVCFTDLTKDEQLVFLTHLERDNLIKLCIHLGDMVRYYGEQVVNSCPANK